MKGIGQLLVNDRIRTLLHFFTKLKKGQKTTRTSKLLGQRLALFLSQIMPLRQALPESVTVRNYAVQAGARHPASASLNLCKQL